MINKVAIVRVEYDRDEAIHQAIERAIELIGGFHPEEGSTILIKPNLCSISSPESGVTTDVRVVEGLIKYLRKKGNYNLIIAESNSDYSATLAFKRLGYDILKDRYGIKLINLSKLKSVRIKLENSQKISYLEIPEIMLTVNHIVTVAKIKTHALERFTGAWKNLYGLIPRKSIRPKFHPFLAQILYDINKTFMPSLAILDGIYALEGPGPLEGIPRNMGLIICSNNPLSADIIACKILGINHCRVPHIKYALRHDFRNSENITIIGDSIKMHKKEVLFITENQYRLYRLSLWIGKIAQYMENLSKAFFISAYAFRTANSLELVSGHIYSLKRIINEVNEILFKIEV